MQAIGMLLLLIGFAMSLIGGIWLLVVAFQESLLWGVGCILLPFVSLIFAVMFWEDAKKPFLLNIAGIVPMILGMVLSGSGAEGM